VVISKGHKYFDSTIYDIKHNMLAILSETGGAKYQKKGKKKKKERKTKKKKKKKEPPLAPGAIHSCGFNVNSRLGSQKEHCLEQPKKNCWTSHGNVMAALKKRPLQTV